MKLFVGTLYASIPRIPATNANDDPHNPAEAIDAVFLKGTKLMYKI